MSRARWFRLTAAGSVDEVFPLGARPTLESMQAIVGGYIELVPLPQGWGSFELWVNEEGRICDPPLPLNALASHFVEHAYGVRDNPDATIAMLGDCLLRVPS